MTKPNKKICSITDCDSPSRSRGLCNHHYGKWRRHGDPLHRAVREKDKTCTVTGCVEKRRCKGLCATHYNRFLQSGHTSLKQRSKKCSVENCGRLHVARGYCSTHYARWSATGDPNTGVAIRSFRSSCKIEGCNRKHRSKGLCSLHYSRLTSLGDPEKEPQLLRYSPEQLINKYAHPVGDCLVWVGPKNHQGYGRVRGRSAHRYFWELAKEPIPDGYEIDHICHNPSCIKIDHLRLATRKQNAQYLKGAVPSNRSKVRGVSWHEASGKWRARVSHNGVIHSLGLFATIKDAGRAAANKRRELGFPLSAHDLDYLD